MTKIRIPKDPREARVMAGLTQAKLAERCEVTPQTVSLWETRRTSPRGPARMALSAALGQPRDVIDALFPAKEAS